MNIEWIVEEEQYCLPSVFYGRHAVLNDFAEFFSAMIFFSRIKENICNCPFKQEAIVIIGENILLSYIEDKDVCTVGC